MGVHLRLKSLVSLPSSGGMFKPVVVQRPFLYGLQCEDIVYYAWKPPLTTLLEAFDHSTADLRGLMTNHGTLCPTIITVSHWIQLQDQCDMHSRHRIAFQALGACVKPAQWQPRERHNLWCSRRPSMSIRWRTGR